MTFTMTAQEEGEMWAEAAQSVVCDITSETFEFTHEMPKKLGKGGSRGIQVHPEIWLSISDYEYHDDVIIQIPEWEHPLQFGASLSGSVIDEYGGKSGEGYTCISGSGVQRQMSIKISQTRLVGVDIHMSPDVLRTFFPTTDGEILPQLRFLAQGNDWQSLIYPEITPTIQGVIQQMINCPYHGIAKRMYLQAKVLELITLQLTPILLHQGGLQPSPKLKPGTIASIYHAKEILHSNLENPPLLVELAQMVGISDRTLRRGFQQLFGTTVFGYLTDKRMEWAEQVLREGNMTIGEVAHKVGYIFGVVSTATATQPEPEKPTSETAPEQPAAQGDEPIELVVTGEQDTYRPTNGSTATKTDTPLRDIPQSIQVVPQQVLQDQQITNLGDALRNVPGVSQGGQSFTRSIFTGAIIRGFNSKNNVLTDGLLNGTYYLNTFFDPAGIEQIEVLKGPASVLYGQGNLGGIINLITKKPLSDPFYEVEATAGSFNFYRGAVDFSGPLNSSKTVLYRLNAAAQTTGSFIDSYDAQQYFVAPALSWQLSDRTKLTLQAQYFEQRQDTQTGLPAVGTVLPNPNGKIPRDRYLNKDSERRPQIFQIGYNLEHRFSDNWQLRNAFRGTWASIRDEYTFNSSLASDNRTLNRTYTKGGTDERGFNVDTYLVGKFATGSIQHQLVTGFNYVRYDAEVLPRIGGRAASIDLFNPVYGQPLQGTLTPGSTTEFQTNAFGVYIFIFLVGKLRRHSRTTLSTAYHKMGT